MPLIKGRPKTGGRQAGTPNKRTQEIQAYARGIVEDPEVRAQVLAQAQAGLLAPGVLIMLFHYSYGKPKESIDITVAQTVYQVEMA